jgi:ABC-type glycerol-3-phosphate transport system permease component
MVCGAVVTLSLLFSYSVTYIPSYVVFAKIGWINNFIPLIAGAWATSLGLYMMMNFMGQIPGSLLESARMDGCSEFHVWWKIVMPNVKPAWMTIAIFAFSSTWNTSGSFIYSEDLKLMQNVFSNAAVAGSGVARAGAGAAGALVIMIPPVALFLFCQSNILETMTTSGMKD